MYDAIKNIATGLFLLLFASSAKQVSANAFIVIATPAHQSTLVGIPLIVSGSSSHAHAKVRCIFNTVDIGTFETDKKGNWSISFASIPDGTYNLTLYLLAAHGDALAKTSADFTITNPARISIATPAYNEVVSANPIIVTGHSSLPSTVVNVSIDGVVVGSTITDANGDWVLTASIPADGLITLLADLIDHNGTIVASYTSTIQAQIINSGVKGSVPTKGSGSGIGFTYVASGFFVTITYVPPFVTAPIITALGLRPSGMSTVTIAEESPAAVTLAFNPGTTSIHFTATPS